MNESRPITLTIAAMGGQGGGVLQGWMIQVAERAGFLVQATSVPGVAQRTGATIYYLEFYPDPNHPPVMALMPAADTCDLIVASELTEATRMVQRRLVSDTTTTLITSTHRAYTIDEKSHLADGRSDAREMMSVLNDSAERVLAFDMEALASAHNAVISAVMFGAIAGAGVLPFSEADYMAVLQERPVDQAAFAAAKEAVQSQDQAPQAEPSDMEDRPSEFEGLILALVDEVRPLARSGAARLLDYQDRAYANEYLAELQTFCALDHAPYAMTTAVARGLALWMSYEDTIRVAELKTRPERLQALLAQSDAGDSIVYVTEFMKPRVEEIAGSLPVSWGRWLMNSPKAQRCLNLMTGGLHIRSTNVFGYVLLRCVANMRRWRRQLLRHEQEMQALHAWLDQLRALATTDYILGVAVANCQDLVAGYGDTHARGLSNFKKIRAVADQLVGQASAAELIEAMHQAALADEQGDALAEVIAEAQQTYNLEAA